MQKREFRSDTMTQPTPAMREAMKNAELGDDVCGEDPTVNRLEQLAAEKLGKEAALLVPSGTFANQCAIGVHTRPGDEVIVAEPTHVVEHEAGGAGALAGVQVRAVLPRRTDYLTVDDIKTRLRFPGDDHHPDTGLVIMENALGNGTVMPLDEMQQVQQLAASHGVPIHLDGARLFNAALALGIDDAELAAQADSAMFCLSKGLGAPVGSLLCGSLDFIARARRRRKMMGGGMRQAGVIAAPGIIALTDGVARLAQDHDHTQLLAELFSQIPGVVFERSKVQINMLFCHIDRPGCSEQGLVDFLTERDIQTYPPGPWGLRFVISSEVDAADVRALAAATADYLGSA